MQLGTFMHKFLCERMFSILLPESGIAGSCNHVIFSILRNC